MNELHSLIAKMLNNRLTPNERKQLEALLGNDSEARKLYIAQCQLHTRLEEDRAAKELIRATAPIDQGEAILSQAQKPTFLKRLPSHIGIVAASAAISFVGIVTYLNLTSSSSDSDGTGFSSSVLSPQETYEQVDFPESGNLKRPPTNFATVSMPAPSMEVSFNRDIRPILSDNCYHCHGPDAESRKAELRLDIEANAFVAHGKYEPAIVRGDPSASPLYQRITTEDVGDIMPPPESHRTLDANQKELIRKWIEQGAAWEGHWAFIVPEKPDAPNREWGVNEIDAFTHKAMSERGLAPNEEADRPTIARRLALDLTGLPPTPKLVDAFVKDTSDNAYENLVDSLLASTAYGEHQARLWLDAARYADTHGLHLDNYREIWPYRDWVIDAFNDNKPFDAFTVEQIAGDLLPSPSLQQRLATGFNRCNPTTSEGGAIDAEYRAIYAKDRVETTATVFLGLTMGCASCHDHKFDPLSMEDFYRFSAFFNNFDGPIMDGNAYDTRPIVTIPQQQHSENWIQVKAKRDSLAEAIESLKNSKNAEFEEWKANEERTYHSHKFIEGAAFEIQVAGPDKEIQKDPKPGTLAASMGDRIDFGDSPFEFNPDKPFTLLVSAKLPVESGAKQSRIPLIEQFDGDRGWRLSIANSDIAFPNRYQITFELIHSLRNNNLISVTTKSERANPREFSSPTINISYDGSGSIAGLSITSGSRQPYNYSKVIDNLDGSVATNAPLRIGYFKEGLIDPNLAAKEFKIGYRDKSADGPKTGSINSIKFYDRNVFAFEFSGGGSEKRVKEILYIPEERHRGREVSQLETYYFINFVPEYRELRYKQAINDMLYNHIYDQATVSLVMEERDSAPTARILERGEYDKPGKEVFADIPESLGGLPDSAPKNRLGLAHWLVDPSNPLTARVAVNRFWQNLFGTGIVATSEDFGIMGENPSHPELLDWLAIHFQETNWDIKAMIKLMVMSATYRQDSKIDPEELAIDRANRFLARGPRHRLDGEVLRDKALYVSGSLNPQIGGPPVKPYQPEGIWNAVAYSDSNTAHFSQDSGDALYRRSIYTFWKRTAPPPNMVVFDVPSRENCNVRRERTNTPLQALTLMNDPQYVEAARNLAERAMETTQGDESEKIRAMYAFAFGSSPSAKHQEILERSYRKFHSSFAEKRSDAAAFIQVGDSHPNSHLDPVKLASYTMVANQIMNLDSFINKY